MAAITWQNINAPKTDYMPLGMAQNSYNGAIEGLQGLLKRKEAIDTANYTQEGVNNRNTLFNTLYGATTPEQMTALQQSGKLGEMMTGFGSNIADRDKVQAAIDGRLGNLRRDQLAGIQHADAVEEVGESKIRQQAYALANRGAAFVPQAQSLIDTMKKPAEEQAYLRDLARKFVTEGHADADQAAQVASNEHAAKLRPGLETLQRLSIANQRQSLENARLTNTEKLREAGGEGLVTKYVADLKNQQAAYNKNALSVYSKYGVPVNAAGEPDYGKITDPNVALNIQKELGTKASSSVSLARLTDELIASGMPAQKLAQNIKLGQELLTDGGVTTAADAKLGEGAVEKLAKARKAELDKNMLHYGNRDDREKDFDSVMKYYDANMKDTFAVGSHRQGIMSLMSEGGGIDVGGTPYPITPKIMRRFLTEHMEKDATLFNQTEARVTAALKNFVLNDKDYAKDLANIDVISADQSNMLGAQTVKNVLRNIPGIQNNLTTTALNLEDRIANLLAKQGGGTGGSTPKK